MASEVKELYSSAAALTISLESLASSTTGVGRQATVVDNSTTRYGRIKVSASIKLGTSPTASTAVIVYQISSDAAGTPIRTDGAGASNAAWTRKSAPAIFVLPTGPAPSTGDVLSGEGYFDTPGPGWAVGVVNATGASLNSTTANHVVNWISADPESQ
jgi:hypothetical protein